ncbi:MAG: translocation/assembly module TamB domain-containing protein, partial [Bacteroidota bacterium]
MKAHFSRYFTLHDTPIAKASRAQAFSFQIVLRDPRMLTEVFFPQLERLTAGVIEGTYDSEEMILNVNIDIPTLAYGGLDIDSLSLTVTSDPERLQSAVRVGSIANAMLHLSNVQLSANVEHDSIEVSLQSLESNGGTTMLLAGICTSVPDGYQFRFLPDGIVFQNTPWHVPADHTILFGSNQFMVHHVELRDSLQSLLLNSTDSSTRQPPLNIEFVNFNLATLSLVLERDSGLVRGVLNGNVALENLDKQMAFTSDINIQDFTFARSLVGDINVRANNQTEDVYELTMELTGNDNDIAIQGHYRSKVGGSELDLDLDFNTMNLATLEPFTFGSMERLSGSMTGELHMTGTLRKPSIIGNLQFTNAALNPTMLGSYLRIEDGRITFDAQGIHFQSFELSDTLGHKASLKGNLFTEDFLDFRYDLRIHTEDFLLLNKPSSRDALYYGTVFLDSDIVIGGNQARPVIRMQAQLDKGTDLGVVLPESESSLQQRRGIVRFVEVESKANPIMSRSKPGSGGARDTTREKLSAIDLTANVEVNKESRLRILIDPIAGDSLVIRGEATFSVGVDPSGKLTVTGRYEILEGSYQLSFGDFIHRQFAIEKGSSITWFGSVTEANVDITALYTAKTSALDLVQDQLVGLSPEERNKYKQELRIQVFLMMDGKLLEPNIRFRLDLPPDQRGALGGSIYAKLNELNGQESELNKQVFALLVLGRFISSNPLASASDGGLSGFARSSVSQILTAQLNRLSEQFITGVSLNVGAESFQDYSSGTAEGRTQLQLSLTKQLFEERVTVQVGGNVDLEGRRSQQNSLNNFAGDIKVAYKMTEDGRWQLQVFRQNTHGGAIEGDLVETGLGIIFTIDYDKLFGFSLKPLSGNGDDK